MVLEGSPVKSVHISIDQSLPPHGLHDEPLKSPFRPHHTGAEEASSSGRETTLGRKAPIRAGDFPGGTFERLFTPPQTGSASIRASPSERVPKVAGERSYHRLERRPSSAYAASHVYGGSMGPGAERARQHREGTGLSLPQSEQDRKAHLVHSWRGEEGEPRSRDQIGEPDSGHSVSDTVAGAGVNGDADGYSDGPDSEEEALEVFQHSALFFQ